jgi:P27 family predicted phage terminase small subunit
VKRARGTDRPGRRNPNEPQPRALLPKPPKFLSDEARRAWKQVAPKVYAARLLTELDVLAFTLLCVAWGDLVEAQEKIRVHGKVILVPGGALGPSPYVALGNKAVEQLMRTLVEFGMTPSSRTRVSALGSQVDSSNRFARFYADSSEAADKNSVARFFRE